MKYFWKDVFCFILFYFLWRFRSGWRSSCLSYSEKSFHFKKMFCLWIKKMYIFNHLKKKFLHQTWRFRIFCTRLILNPTPHTGLQDLAADVAQRHLNIWIILCVCGYICVFMLVSCVRASGDADTCWWRNQLAVLLRSQAALFTPGVFTNSLLHWLRVRFEMRSALCLSECLSRAKLLNKPSFWSICLCLFDFVCSSFHLSSSWSSAINLGSNLRHRRSLVNFHWNMCLNNSWSHQQKHPGLMKFESYYLWPLGSSLVTLFIASR